MNAARRWRATLRLVVGVLGGSARAMERMGAVRPAVLRAAHSQLSDDDAVESIRVVVASDDAGAKATLRYLGDLRDRDLDYMTDRTVRLLVAAIEGTAPAPIESHFAQLFERERMLGWRPLEKAFTQLASEVPELSGVADAYASARAHDSPDRSELQSRLFELVGPRAARDDALLRSTLALQIVLRYVKVLELGTASPYDPRNAVWDSLDLGGPGGPS